MSDYVDRKNFLEKCMPVAGHNGMVRTNISHLIMMRAAHGLAVGSFRVGERVSCVSHKRPSGFHKYKLLK